MDTPPLKRRRIDAAASTLKKPFKSPFRTPLKPKDDNAEHVESLNLVQPKAVSNNETLMPNAASKTPYTPLRPSALHTQSRVSTPSTRLNRTTSKPSATLEDDSGFMQLGRESRRLHALHTSLTSDIDTLQQALALLTPGTSSGRLKDDELEDLIQVWKDATRAAAEEVFASTKDRVMKMGGVSAWREADALKAQRQRERQKEDWAEQIEEGKRARARERTRMRVRERRVERGLDPDEEGDDEEEEEESEAEEEEFTNDGVEGEETETAGDAKKDVMKGADDEAFTMDMMLKMLNVDVELVGWDLRRQMWIG
ncbi:hypothetical protein LTS18_004066 [Coniosporium uncinatum]|uniref:Uncharacterized protein n=1 Tax=Coniosporium uncinatum TaxID=93489 RepID=A0ACC3DSM6_9PEZI|nr:hypothetical protein LTS18_004066 [Coniosporium uncinatum]